ncbi:MAG: ABC transporter permease [Planctomycetota bacterium]
MRNALLVAIREFAENARTKGFWIGLLLFPVMILIGMQVPRFLEERATPTRHFVLVDRSGMFHEVIDRQLVRFQTRKRQEAFQKYVQKYGKESVFNDQGKIDLESLPAELADPEKIFEKFSQSNPEFLDSLGTEAGWKAFTSRMEPLLKKDRPPFKEPRLRFRKVGLPEELAGAEDPAGLGQDLKPYLLGDKKIEVDGQEEALFAAILIPADIEKQITRGALSGLSGLAGGKGTAQGIQYWSSNLTDNDLRSEVERAVNNEVHRTEYLRRGVDAKTVQEIQNTRVPISSLNPKKEEGKEKVSLADVIRQWAPVGFVYLLWIAIFTVAQMLLNNTIEEKSNRIIEVLLSSVTPWELMAGKLLGIAAIGLTMLTTWVGSLVAVLAWKAGPEAEWAVQLFAVVKTSGLLPAFGLYFLLGYLMYAGLFLSIGSICNTLKEAQNFMGPVMLIMMVPLLTMMFIPKDPNGTLATILSWIPVYTPFVMMNRAAADPPLFDIVGTLILMVVSTAVVLWLSGKIFRIGILRTGQPPKILELIRWVRGK